MYLYLQLFCEWSFCFWTLLRNHQADKPLIESSVIIRLMIYRAEPWMIILYKHIYSNPIINGVTGGNGRLDIMFSQHNASAYIPWLVLFVRGLPPCSAAMGYDGWPQDRRIAGIVGSWCLNPRTTPPSPPEGLGLFASRGWSRRVMIQPFPDAFFESFKFSTVITILALGVPERYCPLYVYPPPHAPLSLLRLRLDSRVLDKGIYFF